MWFSLRRESNHICAKSLRLEVSGGRSRGRAKKRWRDNIKENTKKYQLTEDIALVSSIILDDLNSGRSCTGGDGQERCEDSVMVNR